MAETAINSLLERLTHAINQTKGLKLEEKHQLESLYEELYLLRDFLKGCQKMHPHDQLRSLEGRIIDMASEAENLIDLFVSETEERWEYTMDQLISSKRRHVHMFTKVSLSLVRQEIEATKTEMMKIYERYSDYEFVSIDFALDYEEMSDEEMVASEVVVVSDEEMVASEVDCNSRFDGARTISGEEEGIDLKAEQFIAKFYEQKKKEFHASEEMEVSDEETVASEGEAMILKERLTGGSKRLDIISIVGMAGLGKTTLARKVYDDPLVVYHFYDRLWIYVSQEFRKRDLLVRLVSSLIKHNPSEINQVYDSDLAQLLYKSLKGKVYLVVMDDIWDIGVWDDLKSYFPNDNNGSRIMFTSRHDSVALLAKPSRSPLSLSFLTDDESWDLLQKKVFGRETCVPELVELGKQIAKKCHGLPLAIVVVAGILVNEQKTQGRWKQVAETLNSSMASDPQLWEKTLALSYNNLPHHLKRCFLYFGVFSKDSQITVQKLVWLWVAEGFVKKTGDQSLEDVARGYLLDLISRSLVLVSKRRYDGGVEACAIHVLLRDFCIKQAEKERSLQQILTGQPYVFPLFFNPEHLCIKDSENAWTSTSVFASSDKPGTFFCFNSQCTGLQDPGFHHPCYDHLRAFDISWYRSHDVHSAISDISDLVKLVHLTYLEFGAHVFPKFCLPASISNLQNLETLIIHGLCVILPQCIRMMVKLRHIHLTAKEIHIIEGQNPDAHYPFSLDDLQTLSRVDPWSCKDFIAGTPNLKKLGFWGPIEKQGCLTFPDLYLLNQLQELKLHHTGFQESSIRLKGIKFPTNRKSLTLERGIRFPINLKKLTLERTFLSWDEISNLGKLVPTLEVLKLLQNACTGPVWETSEVFPQLKFLKYEFLDIVQWNASSNHFPRLQKLELVDCFQLEKVPSEIGDILTLEMIEVQFCIPSLVNSAREIKEEQESMGNNLLQVVIHAWQFLENYKRKQFTNDKRRQSTNDERKQSTTQCLCL